MSTEMLTLDRGDTQVALAGDWHGAAQWAVMVLERCAAAGIRTLYHLGDFGLWPGPQGKHYLQQVSAAAVTFDINIWVTPGNHEDWGRLDNLFATTTGPVRLAERIWALPRGYRWLHAGRSFLSLGGAPSVDFEYRHEGVDWWPTEIIPDDVAAEVIAAGPVEVMLAHDAPVPATAAVERIRASNPMGWSKKALAYAASGAALLTRVYDAVQPQLFAHGHYHVAGEHVRPSGQRLLSLNMNGSRLGNVVLLDLTAPDFDAQGLIV